MSDTPRTDQKQSERLEYKELELVPAAFARQLERELAESRQDLRLSAATISAMNQRVAGCEGALADAHGAVTEELRGEYSNVLMKSRMQIEKQFDGIRFTGFVAWD